MAEASLFPQLVDVGSSANDGTGDPIRTAMVKINENFSYIDTDLATFHEWFTWIPRELTSFFLGAHGDYASFEKGYEFTDINLYWTYVGIGNVAKLNDGSLNSITLRYWRDSTTAAPQFTFTGLKENSSKIIDDKAITDSGHFELELIETAPNGVAHKYTKEIKVDFMLPVFWGSSVKSSIGGGDVLNFTKILGNDRYNKLTYNNLNGEYIYYVIPASYGTIQHVFVNNMSFSDFTYTPLRLNNDMAHTEDYLVYRFNNIQYGTNILVEWA